MAPHKPAVKKDTDGTPRPVGVINPGTDLDQVQGGDPGNTGVFVWEYVVLPMKGVETSDSEITANGEIATETAAFQHGYRPTGPSHLISVVDHPDGVSKVVRWEVPVRPNDAESVLKGGEIAEPHKELPPVRGLAENADKA